MSRPYSPLAVIRAVPRELLRAYCAAHKVPLDERVFDDGTTPTQAVALSHGLSSDIRPRFDGALRDVHDMATEEGTVALVEEANFRGLPLTAEFDALEGPTARALWFLTRHHEAFHTARLLHAADRQRGRYSTAVDGLAAAMPPHAFEDLNPLRKALIQYFVVEQGRGRACHIDPLARGPRLLLFVYLDDYPAIHIGFDAEDRLERRPHRPTFEVVFQFDHAAGTLSVFAKGGLGHRRKLLDFFCDLVLKAKCPSGVVRRPSFRLDHLLRRDATLPLDPAGGATAARLRRLKVFQQGSRESVTLDAAPEGGREDIYRMLDRHFPAADFPRDTLCVSMAAVTVGYTAGGKSRTVTFEVTSNGGTTLDSLADDQQDAGGGVLRAWGVSDA